MEIIALTDIHGSIRHIGSIGDELKNADLVTISGDITNFGSKQDASYVIDSILQYNKNIYAVPGNCDTGSVDAYLIEKGINLHGRLKDFNNICFIGIGGALTGHIKTPTTYSEDQFKYILNKASIEVKQGSKIVFLTHQPPYNTKADMVMGTRHVGSKSVRNFIETYKPMLCLTGHMHESVCSSLLGSTTIVNPGPFRNGRYSIIKIKNNSVNVKIYKV